VGECSIVNGMPLQTKKPIKTNGSKEECERTCDNQKSYSVSFPPKPPHPHHQLTTMATRFLGVILLAILLYAIRIILFRKKAPGPLPPGPVGKPIVGNISDLPSPGTQDWMHWLKHKDQYGTHLN
jgi:hypothetical protein